MSLVPSCKANLAVIDSGVGGLSVLAELRRILPYNSIMYYADTANCPYGQKSREEIAQLSFPIVESLVELGAEVIVVACNTMTAAAITQLRERWQEVEFVGMEPAVKPALKDSKSGVVGVLATPATLSGELYRGTKQRNQDNRVVIEVGGVGLVEFVEGGRQSSSECKELVRSYIEPMLNAGADEIVLGCTHYPFLEGVIKEVVLDYFEKRGRGEGVKSEDSTDVQNSVTVINPAPAVVRRVVQILKKRGLVVTETQSEGRKGELCYYSSGDADDQLFLESFLAGAGFEM